MRHTQKKLSFTSFLTVTTKKLRLTFCYCRLRQFAFCQSLHIILKTFTLTCSSIGKSKYKTYPRYIVIIERKEIVVIQLTKY